MTEKLATKAHEPTRPDREAVAARLEAARRTVQAAPATPAPAISRWSSWYNR